MSLGFFLIERLGNSKDVTDQSINIGENAGNQDIEFNINHEFNSLKSMNKKWDFISIILKSFKYSKLLLINFNSIKIQSFDI